ncbi:MAG: fructose bisphosphate aldolase [Acidimicrobiales bacterium]|jgi:fructose-bisphosphate aldolase class I
MLVRDEQRNRIESAQGFIAALDQSGGSTPGALAAYGVEASRFGSDDEMFDLVHGMRSRIMTSPSFGGDRVLGAILFEMTMDRQVQGQYTAEYLWSQKQIVPFLKVDKGLAEMADGTQIMKPNPGLGELLERANERHVYGTKMRSLISEAVVTGVQAVVEQQFSVGLQILDAGLMPIIEPEVSISCPDKAEAEALLREQIATNLSRVPAGAQVMLKLTLPDQPNFYADLIADPRVLRVVALSGGYSRTDANRKLGLNNGMIASFSRALAEGLSDGQSDEDFSKTLDATVASIFEASST